MFAHILSNMEQRESLIYRMLFEPIIVEYETVAFHVTQVFLFSFWNVTDFESQPKLYPTITAFSRIMFMFIKGNQCLFRIG